MHIDHEVTQNYYSYQKKLPKTKWPKGIRSTKTSGLYDDRLEVIKSIEFDKEICTDCGGKGVAYKRRGRRLVGTICKSCSPHAA